ncbi:MAG: zinc ribbon domain-containing protein [Syntrophales bacterium LBB04]|nr:zinc ribbon domain-containing protein [Syntrophales bacterium LBB04]
MPIYEYQCTQCGRIYEVFQNFKDEPLKKCKDCLGEVTKLISNCSFQLKGTGWYVTDYARKEEGKDKAESKTEEKKSSDNNTSIKTEPAHSKTNE